jgi:hypothetical protein
MLIVWGGSNDISRNNAKEALNQIRKFSEQMTSVNLMIMKVPLRHDLMPSLCVNKEVIKFNRQVEKRMKPYPHVKLIDLDLDRSLYTTHGQHLNSLGKELIARKLATSIKDELAINLFIPIEMPWKESLEGNNPETPVLNLETTNYPPQTETEHIVPDPNEIEPLAILCNQEIVSNELTHLQVTTSEGGGGQQGVRTSSRTRKLPGKIDSFLCQTR